jgi:hypothetical protein
MAADGYVVVRLTRRQAEALAWAAAAHVASRPLFEKLPRDAVFERAFDALQRELRSEKREFRF